MQPTAVSAVIIISASLSRPASSRSIKKQGLGIPSPIMEQSMQFFSSALFAMRRRDNPYWGTFLVCYYAERKDDRVQVKQNNPNIHGGMSSPRNMVGL